MRCLNNKLWNTTLLHRNRLPSWMIGCNTSSVFVLVSVSDMRYSRVRSSSTVKNLLLPVRSFPLICPIVRKRLLPYFTRNLPDCVSRPQEVNFLITYRQQGKETCLNYIRNEIRFKCDWKRRLFSSSYTARSEMVVVEREEYPERVIARRDAFKSKQIFYDVVKEYWNEDYWKDYNIIEPTESLENAVKKLRKQL